MNKDNFKLIAHALVKINGKYLVIKRNEIKRGKPNTSPLYYDIPGGMVEVGETPMEAAIRETKEEVNLDIEIGDIIHVDSNLDKEKNIVFTRLVFDCKLKEGQDISNIILQEDEHSEYKLITNVNEIDKTIDYLDDCINHSKKINK